MRRWSKIVTWIAVAFCARPLASAQEVNVCNTPPGMVWIPGGEFEMGAVVNGHSSCEMPMASNDAEPIRRVRVDLDG
jgi:formylglycine-generating enzyme required for sulfatase activity